MGRGPERRASHEAETYRAEAAALVDSLSDQELALRLDAAINLAGAELYLDRFDDAGRHAERVVAVARATGQPAVVVFAFMLLAWARMLRGELADGGEMLDAAIEEARLLGNAQSLAGLLLNRSLTALAAGDIEIAVSAAEESVELTRGMDNGLVPAATGLALAAARLETGDPDLGGAVELLLERTGGAELPLMPGGSFRAKWLELLTRCWLALGPPGGRRTRRCVRRGQRSLDGRAADGDVDGRSRARQSIALASGDAASAADRALASAAAADDVGVPVEAALSRALAGRALAQAGEPERAVAGARAGRDAFHACGARRYRDAADHELRRLGRHVHRRTQPGQADAIGVDALTERESAGRAARRRSQDEPGDRRHALPQPEDRRDAHAKHLPQARRRLTSRRRAGRRARRPGRARTVAVARIRATARSLGGLA